jgi:hypothetical protein
LPLLTEVTEIIWQVTSYSTMFEVGSPHLIHGKTTILPVDHDTPELRRGLLKAVPSRNGNLLDQDPFYGFMGNVSPPTSTLFQGLMAFAPDSRRGKECPLVSQSFDIFVLD